jgi:hypothetical protein
MIECGNIWVQGNRYVIRDARYEKRDTGCKIPDAGYQIQDVIPKGSLQLLDKY